jgi:AraC family transcriptional regulator
VIPHCCPSNGLLAWRLKRVTAYIDANLTSPIQLRELALVAGFSRMHFARTFRVSTGLRPHEYLVRRRIDHAKRLLLQSQTSVARVALLSGFTTHAHFTNVFRNLVGSPPAEWRRHRDTKVSFDTNVQSTSFSVSAEIA